MAMAVTEVQSKTMDLLGIRVFVANGCYQRFVVHPLYRVIRVRWQDAARGRFFISRKVAQVQQLTIT